jgi:preprotein translocase subunit SecF
MIKIIQFRYWLFGLSLLVIVPGMIALSLWGLPLSIDYVGGTLLELQFNQPVDIAQVRQVYAAHGLPSADTTVQNAGPNVAVIRSLELTSDQKSAIIADLEKSFGPSTKLSDETVGPAVGKEVAQRAAYAVALAAIGILLYITIAFRKVEHAFRYGVCAIIAMLHDILVVVGMAAILGKLLGWEVDALYLTALLTVAGFSVHDTIVVFDRIRENAGIYRKETYETVVNHSVVQTLDRSINTQLTVMMTLLALALFGGVTIHHFVVILLIGVFSGTYSSIFNAAALLVVWENREWGTWFRRRPAAAAQG